MKTINKNSRIIAVFWYCSNFVSGVRFDSYVTSNNLHGGSDNSDGVVRYDSLLSFNKKLQSVVAFQDSIVTTRRRTKQKRQQQQQQHHKYRDLCKGNQNSIIMTSKKVMKNGNNMNGVKEEQPPPALTYKERMKRFRKEHSIWDLINPSKPWVLVENGSILGFFDWVPINLRVGPWSKLSYLCFSVVTYLLVVATKWMMQHQPNNNGISSNWFELYYQISQPYEAYTKSWYCNIIAFIWMLGVSWNILTQSPLKSAAWITYTVQSWTMITLRYLFCIIAPFNTSFIFWAEILRFPVLITGLTTFVVWNIILFPGMMYMIKDKAKKSRIFGYFTNFRLTQLHVFNIFFAIVTGIITTPIRSLHLGDLYISLIHVYFYMIWYYTVLDRFGIHLYPIFSPRSPIVVLSWTLVIASYIGGYILWKRYLP